MPGLTESVSPVVIFIISSTMQGEYVGEVAIVCGLSHAVNKMRTESASSDFAFSL